MKNVYELFTIVCILCIYLYIYTYRHIYNIYSHSICPLQQRFLFLPSSVWSPWSQRAAESWRLKRVKIYEGVSWLGSNEIWKSNVLCIWYNIIYMYLYLLLYMLYMIHIYIYIIWYIIYIIWDIYYIYIIYILYILYISYIYIIYILYTLYISYIYDIYIWYMYIWYIYMLYIS